MDQEGGKLDSRSLRSPSRIQHVRSFEEVVTAFEAAVGTLEDTGVPSIVAASKDAADFEPRLHKKLGPSGFTRFFTADHGEWLALVGQPAKVRVYTIGNPLIAITMLRHDIRVGLNVPVRVTIYRDDASGTPRFGYAKLAALAEQVTVAQA